METDKIGIIEERIPLDLEPGSPDSDSLELLVANTAFTFTHEGVRPFGLKTRVLPVLLSLALITSAALVSCRGGFVSSAEATSTPTATLVPTNTLEPTATPEPSPTATTQPPTESPTPTEPALTVADREFTLVNGKKLVLPEANTFQAALNDALQLGLKWNDVYYGGQNTPTDYDLILQGVVKIENRIPGEPTVERVYCPGTQHFFKVSISKAYASGGSFVQFYKEEIDEETGNTIFVYYIADENQSDILKHLTNGTYVIDKSACPVSDSN